MAEHVFDVEVFKGECAKCGKPVFVKVGEKWASKSEKVWHMACSDILAAPPPQDAKGRSEGKMNDQERLAKIRELFQKDSGLQYFRAENGTQALYEDVLAILNAPAAQTQEVPAPDYARIIAEDDATLKEMREKQNPEWRTVIVGLPILRKLLNGEDVTLESFKVNLIPDDVLFNNKPAPPAAPLEGHEWTPGRNNGCCSCRKFSCDLTKLEDGLTEEECKRQWQAHIASLSGKRE